MTNLIGEIEKIGAYAKGGRITREDIDADPQLDAVVFRMTDFDRAASVLGELYQMRSRPSASCGLWAGRCASSTPPGWAIEKGKGPLWRGCGG